MNRHVPTRALSLEDSLKLLGLDRKARFSKTDVEQAYLFGMKHWTTAMHSALSQADRERASDMVVMLREAKTCCVKHLGASKTSSVPKPAPQPHTRKSPAAHTHPVQAAAPTYSPVLFWRDIQNSFSRIAQVIRAIFMVIGAVFYAIRLTVRGISNTFRHLERIGIPRFAVVLVLLISLVSMLHSCSGL